MSAQIIRLKEVVKITGLGKSTIYAYMKADKFPKQIRLGVKSSGWVVEEVDNWIKEKIEQRIAS